MALYLGSEKLGVTIGGSSSDSSLTLGGNYKIVRTDVVQFADDGSVDVSNILSYGDVNYIIGIHDSFQYVTYYDDVNEIAGYINSSGAIMADASYYDGSNIWYFDPNLTVVGEGDDLFLIGLGYV